MQRHGNARIGSVLDKEMMIVLAVSVQYGLPTLASMSLIGDQPSHNAPQSTSKCESVMTLADVRLVHLPRGRCGERFDLPALLRRSRSLVTCRNALGFVIVLVWEMRPRVVVGVLPDV